MYDITQPPTLQDIQKRTKAPPHPLHRSRSSCVCFKQTQDVCYSDANSTFIFLIYLESCRCGSILQTLESLSRTAFFFGKFDNFFCRQLFLIIFFNLLFQTTFSANYTDYNPRRVCNFVGCHFIRLSCKLSFRASFIPP